MEDLLEIISALILGYCAKKIHSILCSNSTNSAITNTYTNSNIHDTRTQREKEWEKIKAQIKRNQQDASKNIGAEHSLDHAAIYYRKEMQNIFKSDCQNDPEWQKLSKLAQANYNRSQEEKDNHTT